MTHSRTIGKARFSGWKSLTSVAFLAVGIASWTGCASDTAPTGSSDPGVVAPPAQSNPTGTGETTSTKIDNTTGGTVNLPNGTSLDVPAGALPDGVDTITVTSSPTSAPTEYAAASPVYVFEPDGTVFLKPLTVTIPVTAPAGTDVADLTMLWSRPSSDGFDMVPTTFTPVAGSTSDYLAAGQITHFSRGFCGKKFTTDPHPPTDPYADK